MPQPASQGLPEELTGLTEAEARSRAARGLSNVNTDVRTKSIGQILSEHTFTFFNAIMAVMAVLVAVTGSWRNMLFVFTVLANLVIGVFQEIRSKIVVDRLSVIASKGATVIREGTERTVALDEIVLGDLVRLGRGDQVPADAKVAWGQADLDESLLTGESVPVRKEVGDELLSGSYLDAGLVVCEVVRVGADGYAARINAGAKKEKHVRSEILASLDGVIQFATYLLVPLGLLLFARTLHADEDVNGAILSTVSAVIGMIPQGLVLLTSTVFAIASTRLARHMVLVQQMYCIEMLARVDVLCLDKTGTITSGSMEVEELRPAPGVGVPELGHAVACLVAADRDPNQTAKAIAAYVEAHGIAATGIARHVPFSSATKRSGCLTTDGRAYVMGAAGFVLGERAEEEVARLGSFGPTSRVLAVCEADGLGEDGSVVGEPRLLGCVALRDELRPSANETIGYFCDQGVSVRVISGDDAATVAAIAQRAGVPGAGSYVDASTLTTPEELRRAAESCSVFGRVTPDQKRELVRALKAAGHVVAMTGDGVNDVLALREADCSVAMASGSDAARNVSELVLVDNDFAHMPAVVAQGRLSINNLQRSASLFLVKTVFSALLAFVCVFWPPYPFLPIQMTLVATALIGVPSFVLALEPNSERVRGDFLANVLKRSLPASLGIVLGLVAVIAVSRVAGWSDDVTSTVSLVVVSVVGTLLIWRISQPLNVLRAALLVVVLGMLVLGFTTFSQLFLIAGLDVGQCAFAAAASVLGGLTFDRIYARLASEDTDDARVVALAHLMERGWHGRSR